MLGYKGKKVKKKLVYILCWFIPSRKMRRLLWNKTTVQNNIIEVVRKNGERIRVRRVKGCKFAFTGSNNHIVLHEPLGDLTLNINVSWGVYIELQSSVHHRKITVTKYEGKQYQNSLVIGRNFASTNDCKHDFCMGPGNITIGCDCLFAEGLLWTGDWHTIYDCNNGKILNHNSDIHIGNHVWIASNCMLLKGTKIADNSIVGARSVVNKRFDKSNVIIAGIPATIVKENVNWDVRTPHDYALNNDLLDN